jgi:Glutathione-dependent formaldehyde-activating enzyme
MEPSMSLAGGCACQGVRYRLRSAPMFVHCCHCKDCQRQTGSAFVLNALIEDKWLDVPDEAYVANVRNPYTEAIVWLYTYQESGHGPRLVVRCFKEGIAISGEPDRYNPIASGMSRSNDPGTGAAPRKNVAGAAGVAQHLARRMHKRLTRRKPRRVSLVVEHADEIGERIACGLVERQPARHLQEVFERDPGARIARSSPGAHWSRPFSPADRSMFLLPSYQARATGGFISDRALSKRCNRRHAQT